jgi:hypothetical protein
MSVFTPPTKTNQIEFITRLEGLAGILRSGLPASQLTDDEDEAAAIGALATLQTLDNVTCPHCGRRMGERPTPPQASRPLTLRDRIERRVRGHYEEWNR